MKKLLPFISDSLGPSWLDKYQGGGNVKPKIGYTPNGDIKNNIKVIPSKDTSIDDVNYVRNYKQPYEPTQGVKDLKAKLATISLSTTPIKETPLGEGIDLLNTVGDFYTGSRYLMDGQTKKGLIDIGEGVLNFIPFIKGKIPTGWDAALTKGPLLPQLSRLGKSYNNILHLSQKAADVDNIKDGSWLNKYAQGGTYGDPLSPRIMNLPASYKMNSYDKGGNIITDPMGQWAHPGSITRIPSNDITMRGVFKPLIGVSNTGHIQYMEPGKDYKFNGEYVTEYPIMQNGGSKPTSQDSLALYNNTLALQNYYKKYKKSSEQLSSKGNEFENLDRAANNKWRFPSTIPSKNWFGNPSSKTEILKDSDIRQIVDSNKFKQRELATSILDTNAPFALYDRRIPPKKIIHYINEIEGDPLVGDFIDIPSYDPTDIKPYSMRTPAEKIIEDKNYLQPKQKSIKPQHQDIYLTPTNSTKKIIKQSEQYKPLTPGQIIPNKLNIDEGDVPQHLSNQQISTQQPYQGFGARPVYDENNTYLGTPVYVGNNIVLRDNSGNYIGNPISKEEYHQYGNTDTSLRGRFIPKQKNGGRLLSKSVTCSNCGWSWKATDGGLDPLTCHKCGGTIKMKNGGWLDNYN